MLLNERCFVDYKSIITLIYLNQGSEIARADREIACHWFISTTLRVYPKFVLEDHPEGSAVEP